MDPLLPKMHEVMEVIEQPSRINVEVMEVIQPSTRINVEVMEVMMK